MPLASSPLHLQLFNNLPLLTLTSEICFLRLQIRRFRETRNMTHNYLAECTYATSEDENPPLSEYPSETVTIEIICNRGVDLNTLKRIPDLRDFEIKRDGNNPNIIVFIGIYPDDHFNEDSILREVGRYDGNARFA